jgi:uncharacterized membrane protein
MALVSSRKSRLFLMALNGLLVVLVWVMALTTYPRIPEVMPARLEVLGWVFGPRTKSLLFFLFPLLETLLSLLTALAGRLAAFGRSRAGELRREHLYMALVFVNVAFIHLERNVIARAFLGRTTFNRTYFITLLVMIVLICLYYRVRARSVR